MPPSRHTAELRARSRWPAPPVALAGLLLLAGGVGAGSVAGADPLQAPCRSAAETLPTPGDRPDPTLQAVLARAIDCAPDTVRPPDSRNRARRDITLAPDRPAFFSTVAGWRIEGSDPFLRSSSGGDLGF